MLQVNDIIVYENGGVYKIADIESPDFVATKELYYKMQPLVDLAGTIYVKTSNDKIQYRPVISKEEAEQYLNEIGEESGLYCSNDKLREKEYRDIIRSCKCIDCLKMLKGILEEQNRKIRAGKRLNISDEKNLKKVARLLQSEFAVVFDISLEQAQSKITNAVHDE